MQVHINGGGNYVGTVFAFNRFNDGAVCDLGIGNKPNGLFGLGTDWSYAQNANSYSVRNMKVYVSDADSSSGPGGLESTIGDADGYELVYELDIPTTPAYGAAPPQYTVDNSQSIADFSFTRVAYLLELDDKYVWASMGTFTDDASQIGVPCKHNQCGDGHSTSVYNQLVGNVNVVSNVPGLTGNGYVGNIEVSEEWFYIHVYLRYVLSSLTGMKRHIHIFHTSFGPTIIIQATHWVSLEPQVQHLIGEIVHRSAMDHSGVCKFT